MLHIDIINYDLNTEFSLQCEGGYLIQKHVKAQNTPLSYSKSKPQVLNMNDAKYDFKASISPPHLTQDGKLSQEIKEYRKKNNLCLFDGGNHPTHQCQRLIEKLAREAKPPPTVPFTPTSKVCHSQSLNNVPLTICLTCV